MKGRSGACPYAMSLMCAAAEAHPNWEPIYQDDKPTGVRKVKSGKGPRTPWELGEWFVANFPEEVAKLLAMEERPHQVLH
jgi:hypothetical protein